jgi:hypothetical protein
MELENLDCNITIPAPIRTTSVFERIIVSGIAHFLKCKDTLYTSKKYKKGKNRFNKKKL